MKAVELIAEVDALHRLQIDLPDSVLPGKVRVLVLSLDAEEDDAGGAWMYGISREWADELGDPREDVYSLEDGEPIRDSR